MAPAAPLARLDRALSAPRPAVVRVLAWAAVNYLLLVVAVLVAYLLVAVPPLSLLPSEYPQSFEDHMLALLYGTTGWPLHLLVVAAVSRTRLARLWVVLASPLLSGISVGLYYLGIFHYDTARSVVLGWTLYALVCRFMPPARRPSAVPARRPGR
ncbi:hypothetical protein [Aquipuribacter hungaricus]|uniref:Uncharacterized protein n=1 Tax=Aquipuribacter hungaricus TaxID=545624 RepID=A0ABV7WAI6_9MICO